MRSGTFTAIVKQQSRDRITTPHGWHKEVRMARKLITSYQRAVELSEKAALEQQVASSFIKHWEDVLVAVDAEFNAITDAQKEQTVHVFEAVSHFWKNENIVGGPYPGDRTKVADYLYGRSRKKGSWLLADAVPQYLLDIPVISDAEFQTRYNLSERLALIKQLNEVKGRQTKMTVFLTLKVIAQAGTKSV